ncbi:MAG: aminopeptidase N [Rhizobiaceae bacterium]
MRKSQGQVIHLKNYQVPEYSVLTVDLDVNLDETHTIVRSKLVLQRGKLTDAGSPVQLDGDELKLVSVSVGGKRLSDSEYKLTPTALTLLKVPKKRKFTVEIETEINPTANTKLMGLYRSGGNYCTQCEAEGFRRITYFPDRPDVLAVYTTRIEADRSEAPVLLGNGNLVKKGSAGKGRHYSIWHDPHPKPSYLFALVGGDLGSIHKRFRTASGRNVKLGIYVEKGKEESAYYAMDSLVRSMRWDEQVFGCEYDLDVFNIVAVSDFNMGAMENKGLNIFNDKYVLANPDTATDADYANIEAIIAHEYFHNWTGNRITCRDWFQLCLKEGLTVYRDQEFSSDQRSRGVKRIEDVRRLKTSQFPEDAGPLAHPVRPVTYREINNFYTATVYEKGAEIVRMIATLLGERKFRAGMNLYFKRHDGEAATIEQFLACFQLAGKVDLSQFALWYSQAGTPLLSVSASYDRSKNRCDIEFEQFVRPTPGQSRKAPMHIPQAITLLGKDGTELPISSIKGAELENGTVHLKKRRQKITFEGLTEKPIVSLNRGFTAPVEINFRQSSSDLVSLAIYETDGFARWQAFQDLATRSIIRGVKSAQSGDRITPEHSFLEVGAKVVSNSGLEPAFRATMLTLPSEGDLAQAVGKNVNPDAIQKSWTKHAAHLGKRIEDFREHVLNEVSISGTFNPNSDSAGKRSLSAVFQRLGVLARSKSTLTEIENTYFNADNMTDRFNSLATIVHFHPSKELSDRILEDFYDRYHEDHIVLDKWFSVQASKPGSGTTSAIKRLMKHKDFSLNNPNRLRSLIGVFAMANPTGFNAKKGNGYKLVTGIIGQLDSINPQVAARLLTSFRSYGSLEPARRKLAHQYLTQLQERENLSRDVSDILDRILASENNAQLFS